MSEWQPIETAPKDGTEFQAWVVCENAKFWEPKARFNIELERFERWGRVDHDLDGWVVYYDETYTHWMPLPPPPKDAA